LLWDRSVLFDKPIDRCDRLLNFISDDVPPHFVGLPIYPFAMWLVGEATELGIARPGVAAIDQRRHDDLAAVFREAPRELRFRRYSGRNANQHFRRLIGVGNRHDPRDDFSGGLEKKAFSINTVKNRPAHGVNAVPVAFGNHGHRPGGANVFQGFDPQPLVHRADAVLKMSPIGLNGLFESFGR